MEGQKPGRGGSQGRIARHERSAAQRALILDGSPSGGYGGQNQLQHGALLYYVPYVPLSHPFVERIIGPSDASIWIGCCFGRQQTSKTNCSISGPTLTVIARIPRWEDERRMRSRHDQSSISARLAGNLTVGTYIRRQWLRDFQKTLDRCDIRSNSARLPRNHSVFLAGIPWLRSLHGQGCVLKSRRSSLSQ